ncbi:MAG: hypothetical protein HYW77_02485 [Parcubacteria group bacterium]|nr:hypothetical protein [Parcubacteria group bacterium]
MLLSRPDILKHMNLGNILIDPFQERNLGTNSYDITLGNYYFREQDSKGGLPIFNPFSRASIERVWGKEPQRAVPYFQFIQDLNITALDGFIESDLIICLAPGETILAHTQEFIGGRNCCTSEMKARSTLGRSFIEVCKCAGMGDVGYVNRWTMEITNNSCRHHIPLRTGMRVGQIKFYEVRPLEDDDYSVKGKYQTGTDLETLKNSWVPYSMLPRLYSDYEIVGRKKEKLDSE